MDDLPTPDPDFLPEEPPVTDLLAKKPHGWLFTLLIVGLTVLCLGGLAAAALVIRQLYQGPAETQVYARAIDEFMAAASRHDAPAAFAFLSQEGQNRTPLSKLEQMLRGRNFAWFADYRSVHITAFHSLSGGQDEAVEVTGVVTYSTSYLGQLKAVMQKQAGEWLIFSFEIKVPPGKYGGVSSG